MGKHAKRFRDLEHLFMAYPDSGSVIGARVYFQAAAIMWPVTARRMRVSSTSSLE